MASNISLLPEIKKVKEVWEWKTDVLSTHNGSESRLSIREKPRVFQRASFDAVTQTERRELIQLLATDLPNPNAVPLWAWGCRLTAASTSGTNSISLATARAQLAVGDALVLVNPATGETEDFYATAASATTVTLDSNLSQNVTTAWIAYKAMPALIEKSNFRWNIVDGTFDLDCSSWVPPYVEQENTAVSLTTFNSLPLLEKLAIAGASEGLKFETEVIDFGGYRVIGTQVPNVDFTGRRVFTINRLDTDDIDYWKLFLNTVKGAWKAFLMDTQLDDMTLASGLSQGGTTMSINETEQSALLHAYDSFKNFQITYSNGTTSQHTISSSTSGSVTFSPALPSDPKVSNVDRISYLLKVRMSDRIEFRHGATRSELSFDYQTTDDG